jgi:hypothetical protein
MCNIPDSYVDALEMTALAAFGGVAFDLSYNRTMFLDWLGHLGYYAEFQYSYTTRTHLRSSADLVAFAHAQAFSLPHESRQNHIHPIHLTFLENLSFMLCLDLGVTPLRPHTSQFNHHLSRSLDPSLRSPVSVASSKIMRPTAADVLADLAEECTSRLLYPFCVRVTRPNSS